MVRVTLSRDDSERVVELPDELKKALAMHHKAAATFASLAYSRRKEFADWIATAKRPETRAARLKKALTLIEEGQKLG